MGEPWLFFEATRGHPAKRFGKHCIIKTNEDSNLVRYNVAQVYTHVPMFQCILSLPSWVQWHKVPPKCPLTRASCTKILACSMPLRDPLISPAIDYWNRNVEVRPKARITATNLCDFKLPREVRYAPFWDITQQTVVIPYRRLGTTYLSHLDFLILKDGIDRLYWNVR